MRLGMDVCDLRRSMTLAGSTASACGLTWCEAGGDLGEAVWKRRAGGASAGECVTLTMDALERGNEPCETDRWVGGWR